MKFWCRLTVALSFLVITIPVHAQTTLRVSSWVPLSHAIVADMIVPWGKEVERVTEGRVKLRILPKPVATAPQHLDAVANGVADVGFITHGLTPGRFVATKVVEFPFMGNTAEAVSVAYQRIHDRYLAKLNEANSVVTLSVWTHGPAQIFTTKRPIARLQDFEGLKIRVSGGLANELSKAMGVVTMLAPAPQSYELLSSGVADGIFFPEEATCAFNLDSVITQATLVPNGLYNVSFALIMNRDRFQSLSEADQKAIMELSGEAFARRAGKAWDASDARCHKRLLAAGVKFHRATPEMVNEIAAKAKPVEEAWYAEVGKLGVDGAKVLAELRAEIKKLEGQ